MAFHNLSDAGLQEMCASQFALKHVIVSVEVVLDDLRVLRLRVLPTTTVEGLKWHVHNFCGVLPTRFDLCVNCSAVLGEPNYEPVSDRHTAEVLPRSADGEVHLMALNRCAADVQAAVDRKRILRFMQDMHGQIRAKDAEIQRLKMKVVQPQRPPTPPVSWILEGEAPPTRPNILSTSPIDTSVREKAKASSRRRKATAGSSDPFSAHVEAEHATDEGYEQVHDVMRKFFDLKDVAMADDVYRRLFHRN